MKYDYHFNNETISIDIPDSDYDLLIEMDRIEHNINQKETRRHVSLEACDKDDNQLPSNVDVEATCIQEMEIEAIRRGLQMLGSQQRELIWKVYYENQTVASIAREENVDKNSVRERLQRCHKKLKKIIDDPSFLALP